MNCYRIYSFFIYKLSNAAKVINKGHLRGFSLPNVHYALFLEFLGILEKLEILCEPAFTSLPKVQHPSPYTLPPLTLYIRRRRALFVERALFADV
ncbi:hypothetical protein CTM53_11235 [Prevotella intermedia]|uniref:Uncharacterized protein n=1 Tax=Prevotella intermedia TaxID=28131 RepID=A0AAJ3RQC1_PREIN|nr:hypothetical protein CTM61_09800 [Prevotella intermedia]PJI19128.1 hypothetical protein CTM53_11235 [Prevotella intermedia]